MDREPTPDELAGMAWWNGMTDDERSSWLYLAGTAVPADAWAYYKSRINTDLTPGSARPGPSPG